MAKRIFVTATNTDIGKTYTSLQLIKALSQQGYRVGVYKPIETGVTSYPMDGKALFETALHYNPSLKELDLGDIVTMTFPLPASPFVASGGEAIDLARFEKAIEKIERFCDIVIIEGAGGLMVPVDAATMMIDLPRYFGAVTLLVTHCRLGCINDTLLSLQALESRKLPHRWVLNCRGEESGFEQTSLPYFQHRFGTIYRLQDDIHALAQALLDTIPSAIEERPCDI